MRIDIFTLFPTFFDSPLRTSLLGKAIDKNLLKVNMIDFRDYATDKHKSVDAPPYGGGPGMLLRPEPIDAAFVDHPLVGEGCRIYLTPAGYPANQTRIQSLVAYDHIQLLCGRYEGVDERVLDKWIDLRLSVGDFVLSGGESAALCVVEALSRFVPGVLGEAESLSDESFADGQLEGPQYTRPPDFDGRPVPEILVSGHHANIIEWRKDQSLKRTREYRPDLLDE